MSDPKVGERYVRPNLAAPFTVRYVGKTIVVFEYDTGVENWTAKFMCDEWEPVEPLVAQLPEDRIPARLLDRQTPATAVEFDLNPKVGVVGEFRQVPSNVVLGEN